MKEKFHVHRNVHPENAERVLNKHADEGWKLVSVTKDQQCFWDMVFERDEPEQAAPEPEYEMRQENVWSHNVDRVESLAAAGWQVVSALQIPASVTGGSAHHNLILQRRKPPGCDHDWEDGFSMNGPTKTCRKCGKFMRD